MTDYDSMLVPVDPHWSKSACFTRRANLCLGYTVDYDRDTGFYHIDVYSIQNGRSNALMGELRMKVDEWAIFHKTLYKVWELLEYPKKDDKELV